PTSRAKKSQAPSAARRPSVRGRTEKPSPRQPKVAARPSAVSAKPSSGRPNSSAKPSAAGLRVNKSTKADISRDQVIIPPPPLDGKPRKNQAGMNARELAHFRDLLLAKRRELVGDMSSMEREALRSATGTNLSSLPLHMADQGTDNYEQEFTLGLVEKDRQLLREINRALSKILDGTYGLCEGTGKPINKARLEFQPWAKYSIEYARQLEKGLGMMMRR